MTAAARLTGKLPADGRTVHVHVSEGRIAAIEPASAAAERWIAPGLLDLQVNGYGGHDVNAPGVTPETIIALTRRLWEHGVTGWCPTIVTAPEESVAAALRAVTEACREDPLTAHSVLGVHVEGPHVAREDGPRGAHDTRHVRPPDLDELSRWREISGDLLALVTLSPEYDDAPAYIRELAHGDVVACIGHTAARPEGITPAVDAGARMATHLGNGAHAVLPRHPNYLWSQLADDRLAASFIADGHHLPGTVLTSMIRAKGVDRSILVSDSSTLGGLPAGEYETPVGGRVHLSPDGRLSQADTPYLAGAAANLADGVARATDLAGLPLGAALRMATENPARVLGHRGLGRGELRVGAPADLVTFRWKPGDRTLRVEDVLVAGHHVVGGAGPTSHRGEG